MEDEKQEKSSLSTADAKLLSHAIKELNISKKNVGLYPRNHPLTTESIKRAFRFLQKLFESKGSITLGIARDSLIIDGAVLDKETPALNEFALSLHSKGIAAITLSTTLTIEELFIFHELLMEKDTPMGPALLELAEKRGLRDITLTPLDLSKFKFIENITRKDGFDNTLWEDYVIGLLEGKLADEDVDELIDNVSPKDIASVINKSSPENISDKACDTMIHSYLERKTRENQRTVLLGKFLSMVDNLTPELKQQFLTRSFNAPSMDADEIEKLLGELTFDDINIMIKVFSEQSSLLPERLKNLIDKLNMSKMDIIIEIRGSGVSYVDDIEVNEKIVKSFKEDHASDSAEDEYREKLRNMLESPGVRNDKMTYELEEACKGEIVDRTISMIMFELLKVESNSREEYRKLLSSLADLADGFIETGRFSEISEIYNNVYSHSLAGIFREDASEMIKSFFGSQMFLLRLIDAFKVWGRHNREGVIGLSIILKEYVINPLLDALSEEKDTSIRRFFLDVLCKFGSDVVPEAVKRLEDDRWYVIRNMLYLIRECNGSDFISHIRQFTKHNEKKVVLEAVKTLLYFKTPDSISYIKHYMLSKDTLLREQTVRLAGVYRVKEAVPYMIELLEKKDLFGAESFNKVSIVKALGDIGEPSALKILYKICDSNSLLYKSELEKLKIEIFKNLQNYPFQDVKPLLELGLKSKIKDIQLISEKLQKSIGEKHE